MTIRKMSKFGVSDMAGSSTAIGRYARAEGLATKAQGEYSHTEGQAGSANGKVGHSEGLSCGANGDYSHAQGNLTTSYGVGAHSEGDHCIAVGNYSHSQGSYANPKVFGEHAIGAGLFAAEGDAQAVTLALRVATTGTTPAVMTTNGLAPAPDATAPNSPNVLVIPYNRAFMFTVHIVARHTVNDNQAGWIFRGLIARPSTGPAYLRGALPVDTWSYSAGPCDAAVTIDTTSATNNYLKLAVTGEYTTTRWAARIDAVEVG